MLTVFGDGYSRDCERWSRRQLLQVGSLAFGGLTLPDLFRADARAASGGRVVRDQSVVFLNLQGGPTQVETFDPKMQVPKEYRAMFGEVKTCLPGVTFGSHFPKLAGMADRLSVVRSYRHGISSHGTAAKHVAAGGNGTGATLGTLYAAVAGLNDPGTGMPNNTLIIPAAIDEKYKSFNAVPSRVTDTGSLPGIYKAFDPSAGGQVIENMQLRLPERRLSDRRSLLESLDGLKRRFDATDALAGADTFQQQAFDVILGGINDAFDLSQETPALVREYDTSMFEVPQPAIDKRKRKLVKGHSPVSLGKQMLLARRVVEAGCGFVTVTSAGWDMHGAHEFEIADGMPVLGPAVDKAVSAFLTDLHQRGLSENVLLVITGEFGRTPKINNKRGRDHWGSLCPLVFAGGGLPMGRIIGQSDRHASEPASDPIASENVLATIMHTLLDIGELRTRASIPNDVVRVLTQAEPISQLVG